MASQDDALAVKTAIDLTLRTIEERARLYRNLVVAVSVLLGGSVVASMIVKSWWPLTGLVLIVPATAIYLALDMRLVRQWVLRTLGLRDATGVSLHLFSTSISAYGLVPKGTLQAMLMHLNAIEDSMAPGQLGEPNRLNQ